MKNLKYLIPFLIIPLIGCESKDNIQETPKQLPLKVYLIDDSKINGFLQKVTFENHDYLLFSSSGKSIIHSESCPCKSQ